MQIKGTYKDIWTIAYPIILGSFAQSINQMIDTAFMGHVGMVEMGAANLGGMLYFLLVIIGMGFTKGGQIMVARKSGEMDYAGIGEVFWHLVGICLGLGIVLFIPFYIFSENIFGWIIRSPETLTQTNTFFHYRIFGLFFGLMNAAMNGFFSGVGRTKVITISTILMALTNILLDYTLIFGHFGFHPLGIKGAAIATDIAEFVGLSVFIGALVYRKFIPKFNMWPIGKWRPALAKELTWLSTPLAFQHVFGMGSWLIFFFLIEKLGERPLAISSIIKSLYIFIGIPAWSLGSAGNTVVSNILGQDRKEEILRALKKVVYLSLAIGLGQAVFISAIPAWVLKIYTTDIGLIHDSIPTLYIILYALVIMSVSTVLMQGIMGMGMTKFSLVVEVSCAVSYLVFIAIVIFIFKGSLPVIWSAEILYWLIMLILCYICLKGNYWKKMVKDGKNKILV